MRSSFLGRWKEYRVNKSFDLTANVFHAVFEKWALEGLKPNEPLSKELIIEGFQGIGLEPTKDILEVFTILNGFDDGTMDDECLQFWAFPKIVDEYKNGSSLVAFADFLIDSHRYAFAVGVEPAPIYIDYGSSPNIRIADSFADLFLKYLKDPTSVLG